MGTWLPGAFCNLPTLSWWSRSRMRVLGFARAAANLEMEKEWKYEDGVCCDVRSGNKPTKRVL